MCNLSGKRVAGCVIWRVNGSQQIYGCGVMRPGRVHSADLRGPCSRLLKTFKSSDLCIGLVGYLETIRAKGLGSKISSFECIWVSRKHKKLFFLPRRSPKVFDVSLRSSTCAQTVAVGQQEASRKTVSEYLQSASAKMMLGLFPPSSSVTLFRLLFPAASWISLPTCGERRAALITGTSQRSLTKSQHQWDAVINKSCQLRSTSLTRRPAPLSGPWDSANILNIY